MLRIIGSEIMTPRTMVLCLAAATLGITGIVFGLKFIKKRNYLLGIEWVILGISSTNATVFFATGWPLNYEVAHFFDAFSRAFGIPIVATLGLMMLTHRYRPSIRQDVLWFAGSFLGAAVLVWVPYVAKPLPYFYVVMDVLYSAYLVYFAKRLLDVGENAQAAGVILVTATQLAIACIYDFYKIPGEQTNVIFNFFTLALFTWSYMTVQLYYAYCALERRLDAVAGVSGLRTEASLT